MKIAILGAMQEEIAPLLEKLDYKVEEFANNKFYFAKYKNHDLVIAHSKIGKVNSTLMATLIIQKYGASMLLFTGVAGSCDEKLKICDLLAASELVQYDLDITAFGHPLGFVPGSPVFVQSSDKLNKIAKDVANELNIDLHFGVIASGDQFICDEKKKDMIKKEFNASAIEMEGASVAQVCYALNIPFFILRAISDEAGKKAEFDFDEFLDKSAKLSADFILKMVEKIDNK